MRRLIFVSAAVATIASCGGSGYCSDRPDRHVERWGTPPPRDTAADYMLEWGYYQIPAEAQACPLVYFYDNRP